MSVVGRKEIAADQGGKLNYTEKTELPRFEHNVML